MPFDTSEPTPDEIEKWFLNVPEAPKGTFEFALVLGGTVSAGCYTAGALDFLFEALDWFTAYQQSGGGPPHKVVLKLITGTSGGGVNAAIAARALAYDYPHITRGLSLPPDQTGNPFYDPWVNTLRLADFLSPSDIQGQVRSVLNGAPIDNGARQIITFEPGPARARSWVASPLRVILTVTSLRGVPYATNVGNGMQSYVDHADYARFALVYPGQQLGEPRPDEEVLAFGNERLPQMTDWDTFSQFARATAAFPLGFPARALSRPTSHYRWRVVPYPPGPGGGYTYQVRKPDWITMGGGDPAKVPEDWHFLAVDGGTTDNEPIELARTSLAGLLGRNPRDPKKANRAVWLIDPFAGVAKLGPDTATTFANDAGAVITTLTQQTRYDSADILLAADSTVFSRFMLAPQRADIYGEDALASGGVGAFIGFACPDFMRFDYLLGRKNCQEFLQSQFLLAEDNPVFDGWSDAQRRDLAVPGQPGFLPIIPLYGDAKIPEKLDPWPRGKLNPESYRSLIQDRFRAIAETELAGGFFESLLGFLAANATQKYVSDYAINAMKAYLDQAGLS